MGYSQDVNIGYKRPYFALFKSFHPFTFSLLTIRVCFPSFSVYIFLDNCFSFSIFLAFRNVSSWKRTAQNPYDFRWRCAKKCFWWLLLMFHKVFEGSLEVISSADFVRFIRVLLNDQRLGSFEILRTFSRGSPWSAEAPCGHLTVDKLSTFLSKILVLIASQCTHVQNLRQLCVCVCVCQVA